jgi:hypothetical protein
VPSHNGQPLCLDQARPGTHRVELYQCQKNNSRQEFVYGGAGGVDSIAETWSGKGECLCRGTLDRGLRLAPGQHCGLPGQRHRRDGLADGVEQLEHQRLARDRTADQTGGLHGLREHLTRRTGQQGAVEIEEGCAPKRFSRHAPSD